MSGPGPTANPAPDPVPGPDSAPADRLAAALTRLGVTFAREGADAFLVTLPGERRFTTLAWLLIGTHELLIESFVCRRPDENQVEVYEYLLHRNAKLRTVAYTLDGVGDIHLVGRLGLAPLFTPGERTPGEWTPGDPAGQADPVLDEEMNTVLGVLLATSDADFNPILERGFAGAIRREWAWRTDRGQSVRNLQAFRHLIAD